MKHSNLSIFVAHVGCPHTCAFCNQRTITGQQIIPHSDDVKRLCQQALSEIDDVSNAQIAFFGGSFTAIEKSYMLELLESTKDYVGDGKFSGIRISTRPDCIDSNILALLKSYNVTAIELGAQSMCDEVLEANERGHSSADVENASRLIKENGFELGLQMMVGLYKSTPERERLTAQRIIYLKPETVRIYPVVVLDKTKLGELYINGEYKLMDFDVVVNLCADFLKEFEENSIKVIKLGLHASETVEADILAGYYHPAFREICESRIYREKIAALVDNDMKALEISVPKRDLSKAIGQKKSNIEYFKLQGLSLVIKPNDDDKIIVVNKT